MHTDPDATTPSAEHEVTPTLPGRNNGNDGGTLGTVLFTDIDEDRLRLIAEVLAAIIEAPATVCLSGDLGAGKTTFARAFIRAAADDAALDVPSPTFTLVQSYAGTRFALAHADLYRLTSADEIDDLGLEDVFSSGVALIEWPGLADAALPATRFEIAITPAQNADRRNVEIVGLRAQGRLPVRACPVGLIERLRLIEGFLSRTGWSNARVRYLKGDASPRGYARLTAPDGQTAILMNAPRQPDGPPIRDGKPYSAIAHLAEDVRPYLAVRHGLTMAGLRVPGLVASDVDAGLLIVEDLGDHVAAEAMRSGTLVTEIYTHAVDALVHLRRHTMPAVLPLGVTDATEPSPVASRLPDGSVETTQAHTHYIPPRYDLDALMIEVELFTDWFLARARPDLSDLEVNAARASFRTLWQRHLMTLAPSDHWVIRDFHSPNLMILPAAAGAPENGPLLTESGSATTVAPTLGILDFQDALRGSPAYDLVSILQDARVDISEREENELFAMYLDRADPEWRKAGAGLSSVIHLRREYAILGAQRATKILGIFSRLSQRDGKHAYLDHMPRVHGYLRRNLRHPVLADLKDWYDHYVPDVPEQGRSAPSDDQSTTEADHPTTAMILCAGLGTRMRPITLTTPKPLVKVGGRSMLDHILDRFSDAGVNTCVVNAHYLAEQIDAHAASRLNPMIRVSDERRTVLDTGGGVLNAINMLGSGPFYIQNADSLWFDGEVPTLERMAAAWDATRMDTLLLLVPRNLDTGYRGAGDFLLDETGRLVRRGDRPEAPFVFAGLSIGTQRLFEPAPAMPFSLNAVWNAAITRGRAYGLIHTGAWLHIGDPQALADAEIAIAGLSAAAGG